MEDKLYIEVDTMGASNEIMSPQIKIQTLNVIRTSFEDLIKLTTNKKYLDTISYNLTIIEDCYKIDMYKFQFKAITDMMQKEIKNLKESIALQI